MSSVWEGKIERLAWGGRGLARAEDGRTILLAAPLALFPGEAVRAEVRWKARHGEGEVREWRHEDPRRRPPECPWAAECGGCELQGAGTWAAELKRQMVADLFARQLPEGPAFAWTPAPPEVRRQRIQLHWDGTQLGFHARGSHRIAAATRCPAATVPLSEALPALGAALADGRLPQCPQRWELVVGTPAEGVWAVAPSGRAWILEAGTWREDAGPVRHHIEGMELRHQPGAFFQACPAWAARAFRETLEAWDLRGDTLFDLYGGVGLFGALLGTRYARRVLVESEASAVAWAQRNLAALGLPSRCLQADVAEWLQAHPGLGTRCDTLLLDPPRTGLDPTVAATLQSSGAGNLVLVGCDGAAFCRDVRRLSPAWRLQRLTVLDLFPLTHHVECLGLFEAASLDP